MVITSLTRNQVAFTGSRVRIPLAPPNDCNMTKRFNNLSVYRIIAAICILQFHIFYILYNRLIPYETLLSKAVQGLMALSGFLYATRQIDDVKSFYKKRFIRILIPALICVVIMALWDLIYMFITKNYDYISLSFSKRALGGGLLFQPANYYFLAYILICYLITPLLKKNNLFKYGFLLLSIVLELLLAYFFGISITGVCYIVGYLIGEKTFNRYTSNEEKSLPDMFLYLGLTILLLVGFYFTHEYLQPHVKTLVKLKKVLEIVISSAFGVTSFFFIILIFKWLNRYQIVTMKFTDELTYYIYLFNQAFMIGAMNVSLYSNNMFIKYLLIYGFTISFAVIALLINRLIKRNKSTNAVHSV